MADEIKPPNNEFPENVENSSLEEHINTLKKSLDFGDKIELPKIPAEVRIVNFPVDDDNAAKEANKISRRANLINAFSLIINALLFLGTLTALYFTYQSVQSSNDSVRISYEALQHARMQDSLARIRDEKNDIENQKKEIEDRKNENKKNFLAQRQYDDNHKSDSQALTLSKRSLEEQINSLTQTQLQFAVESLPILELTNINIVNILPPLEREVAVKYEIVNFGRFPAKILRTNLALRRISAYTLYNPLLDSGNTYFKSINTIVSNGRNYQDSITNLGHLFGRILEKMLDRGSYFYLTGNIIYTNNINKEELTLRVLYRIKLKQLGNSYYNISERLK